ncbi:MAG: ABC transporter permease [Nanoarchaeota archaeon]
MISDYFRLAVNSITHRKLRSWLTIVGIVIGVAAIIALISLSLGLKATIEEQFEAFGADRILISPQGFQGPGTLSEGLTERDVETLEKIPEIDVVSPGMAFVGEVGFHNQVKFPWIFGSRNADDILEDSTDLLEGRYIENNDKGAATIAYGIAHDLFDDEVRVRNKINIKGKDFRVIGILEPIGNSQDDNTIYITLDDFREIYEREDEVGFIATKVKPGVDIPELQKKVERALERARGDENFQVVTPTQILEQINQVLGVIQAVLVGIAAISLLVGGIGIMNSMYTTVLERTRDIGIMKAIGAKNSDILLIFLIESGLMGFVGGFFGVILGTLISLAIGRYSTQAGFKLIVNINPSLMLFGLLFAFIIGMVSGIWPARQASKLKPVEALRYE